MRWRRVAARAISEISSLVVKHPRQGCRIFLYHSVGSQLANNSYGLSVSARSLEQQMKILSETDCLTIVGLDQSQSHANGLRVAVTFDDGYKDNFYLAAPILTQLNIPFTVFVTSSYLNDGSSEYLTMPELRELAGMPGAEIGSHGVTHARLTECDDKALSRELSESRGALEQMIGKPVTSISYPHGAVDTRVRDAARSAGYTIGTTSRFDINNGDADPLLLNRCEVVSRDSARVFVQKLNGGWDWKRWR